MIATQDSKGLEELITAINYLFFSKHYLYFLFYVSQCSNLLSLLCSNFTHDNVIFLFDLHGPEKYIIYLKNVLYISMDEFQSARCLS